MAKKKERAFFVCPRWNEVAAGPDGGRVSAAAGPAPAKIVLAIARGQPVARSTLRKALEAVRRTSGTMFDVDAYIVDQRSLKPR